MALVNHAKREINAKIVYFGGEGAAKKALLTYLHDRIRPSLRSDLATLGAGGDPLLFFDFSPFDKPVFDGYRLRYHVYTLPGRVANPAAWRMTLKGADGVMIVADAAPEKAAIERENILQLRDYLAAYGQTVDDIPCLLQLDWNGCTRRASAPVATTELGLSGMPFCCSDSTTGEGALEAFSQLSRDIMGRLSAERSGWPAVNTVRDAGRDALAVGQDGKNELENCTDGDDDAAGWEVDSRAAAIPAVSAVDGWQVSLAASDVHCVDGNITIPLMVARNGESCRLVVSVSLEHLVEPDGVN